MSDLDQQLRELFSERASTVGPPPPLPPDLRGVPRTRWWRRHRQWLLVPAAVLITGAVVIPVALVSQNEEVTAMPTEQAQAWAEQVCATRPSERSPTQDDVRSMTIVASAVCRWENPVNLEDDTVGLQRITALSPTQVKALQDFITEAKRERPPCILIDSPPEVEFLVYLRDSEGQDWRFMVPNSSCLGISLAGGEQYQSPDLVNWLDSLTVV